MLLYQRALTNPRRHDKLVGARAIEHAQTIGDVAPNIGDSPVDRVGFGIGILGLGYNAPSASLRCAKTLVSPSRCSPICLSIATWMAASSDRPAT